MSTTHGTTADTTPITEAMIEAMTDEAEQGYPNQTRQTRRKIPPSDIV